MLVSPTFRAFVAIELPRSVLQELERLQAALRQREARGVRWVPVEGIHLTLQFLGETPQEKAEEIVEALQRVARDHSSFSLSLGRLGAFPPHGPARVLWVGLEGATDSLVALQRDATSALRALRLPTENRGFSPHLTLGRVRQGARLDTERLYSGASPPSSIPFRVEGVSLMQSELSPSGAHYIRRGWAKLGEALSSDAP
ncbi:MAG: RNA 2',3'-cyclic phosphodiesterase [Chloroflexi bacterium]|nr:RNA 2',3'-cyclic phosphodiesterase [Chloroflexota bacterium]